MFSRFFVALGYPAVKVVDTRKMFGFSCSFLPPTTRYMLWSGYDTLLLQQVPVMQATSGLGRWKMLEAFTEAFGRAWEQEARILIDDSGRCEAMKSHGSLRLAWVGGFLFSRTDRYPPPPRHSPVMDKDAVN